MILNMINFSLRSKILLMFCGLIIIPMLVYAYFATSMYSEDKYKATLQSTLQSSKFLAKDFTQIIKDAVSYAALTDNLEKYQGASQVHLAWPNPNIQTAKYLTRPLEEASPKLAETILVLAALAKNIKNVVITKPAKFFKSEHFPG